MHEVLSSEEAPFASSYYFSFVSLKAILCFYGTVLPFGTRLDLPHRHGFRLSILGPWRFHTLNYFSVVVLHILFFFF